MKSSSVGTRKVRVVSVTRQHPISLSLPLQPSSLQLSIRFFLPFSHRSILYCILWTLWSCTCTSVSNVHCTGIYMYMYTLYMYMYMYIFMYMYNNCVYMYMYMYMCLYVYFYLSPTLCVSLSNVHVILLSALSHGRVCGAGSDHHWCGQDWLLLLRRAGPALPLSSGRRKPRHTGQEGTDIRCAVEPKFWGILCSLRLYLTPFSTYLYFYIVHTCTCIYTVYVCGSAV